MAIKERREREKLGRRNSILSAAADLFWEKGYEATMDEIAERAELSKPTLYLYFKNKDDLYASIAVAGFEELKGKFSAISDSDDSPDDRFTAMFDAFMGFVMENRQIGRITEFIMSKNGRRKLSDEVSSRIDEDMGELLGSASAVIAEGMDQGVFARIADPLSVTIILWRSMLGVVGLAIEDVLPDRGEDYYRELFYTTLQILTLGIRKR